jgi:hypothetical protein
VTTSIIAIKGASAARRTNVPLDAVVDLVGGRTLVDALMKIGGVEIERAVECNVMP